MIKHNKFDWPVVKKYIRVTSSDLHSPEAIAFCEYLEQIINDEFDRRMEKALKPIQEKENANDKEKEV